MVNNNLVCQLKLYFLSLCGMNMDITHSVNKTIRTFIVYYFYAKILVIF